MAYLVALGALIAAVLLRWALDPLMGETLPLVTLFGAVALAVWVGGYRPAVLVVVLGYVACAYLFIDPRGGVAFADARHLTGLAAYLFTCAIIVAFGEALRAARRRAEVGRESLRTTLASIGDAVIATDRDGRVTSMNTVAESLTGWRAVDAHGKPLDAVFRIVNEETGQPVENPVEKVLRLGRIVGLANHTVLIARDGARRPIDDSAAPIRAEDGEVVGCVLVFRDVTERRKGERALRHQTAMLRGISELTTDLIYVKDRDSRLVFANPATLKAFGMAEAAVVGTSLAERPVAPAEAAAIIANDRRIMAAGETETVEEVYTGASGTRTYLSTKTPMRDELGEVVGIVGISHDITERKRGAALLAGQKGVLEMIASGMPLRDVLVALVRTVEALDPELLCAVLLLDLDGKRVHLGSGQRLPDAFLTALDRLDGTESPEVGPCGMAAHRGTTVLVPDIKTDSRWSAQWRDLALAHGLRACQVVPIFAAEGRVVATFVMYRHRPGDAEFADPQLVQVATHLAGIAIARAQADQALRDADTRKDEFLAMLAHELRNPLAPIRNGVHLLRRAGGSDAAIGSIAAMLERQVAQMVRLVEDLLDVSRITRGRIELRRERIELASVVNQAVEAARARIEGMGHALAVTLPPEPIQLDADAARLTQVLYNLLDNACKFMTQGGRIALTVAREGTQAVVRVRDDGIGIPREQLPRIFDLFVQVDTSLERAASGLGIGLTLVKTLVEMHGGAVAAHSAGSGRGSEFVVRLPVADAGAAAPERAARAPVTAPSRRILIVDDNPDGAASLAMLLELSGHRTERAHDGVEAVEAAERFRPEVVLLDIGLPKLNGYDVCRRIRAQPWGQDVLLVAVTGLGQDEDERRSREAGFDRHLVKPVDHDALAQLLAALPAPGRATRAA